MNGRMWYAQLHSYRRCGHDPVVGMNGAVVEQPSVATWGCCGASHPFLPPSGSRPFASWKLWNASPICLRLFWHWVRAAASRTFWTAGRSSPIRIAMMAITTSNSISVNPRRRVDECDMGTSDGTETRTEPHPLRSDEEHSLKNTH